MKLLYTSRIAFYFSCSDRQTPTDVAVSDMERATASRMAAVDHDSFWSRIHLEKDLDIKTNFVSCRTDCNRAISTWHPQCTEESAAGDPHLPFVSPKRFKKKLTNDVKNWESIDGL